MYDAISAILFASLSEFDKLIDNESGNDAGVAMVVVPTVNVVKLVLHAPPSTFPYLRPLFLGEEFVLGLMNLLKSPIERERKLVTFVIQESLKALEDFDKEHVAYCIGILEQVERALMNAQRVESSQGALRPILEIPYILDLVLPHVGVLQLFKFMTSFLVPSFRMDLYGDALDQAVRTTIRATQKLSAQHRDKFQNILVSILSQDPRANNQSAEASMLRLWIDHVKFVPMDPPFIGAFLKCIFTEGCTTPFLDNANLIADLLCDETTIKLMHAQGEAVLKVFLQGLLGLLQQRTDLTKETFLRLFSSWKEMQNHVHFSAVAHNHPELFLNIQLSGQPKL